MKKKKNKSAIDLIASYLPLDSKRKIQDLVQFIQTKKLELTKKLDQLICINIKDDYLRFYYDCISPIKPHNLPFARSRKKRGKKMFTGGITNTVTKSKKKNKSNILRKNDDKRTIILNPNSSEFNNQLLKENLRDKFEGYEYGLSDW